MDKLLVSQEIGPRHARVPVGAANGRAGAEDQIQIEIKDRFGVAPNFFRLTPDTLEITANLWEFARSAYLDNPLPSLLKERLFVYLSRFCDVRYCITRHVGFLLGLGRPAGDAQCPAQTVEDVIRLLRRPLPRGEHLGPYLSQCAACEPALSALPAPDSALEEALFACATHAFLQTPDAPACLVALKRVLGDSRFQHLMAFLAFVRTAHYWTKVHTELSIEEDLQQLLVTHETLAECLLNDPEAGTCEMSQKLMEELTVLRASKERHEESLRVHQALRESEERLRHANAELSQRVTELQRANIELQEARRAALNVMEDAVQARTALAQSEEALRDSERRFREMIDALPAAIYTTDAAGRLTYFNPAAVIFSGRVPELGTDEWCVSWKLYYPNGTPMPHDECPMAIALKEGRAVRGVEAIAERPDGQRIWFQPYPTPLRDSAGWIVGGINLLMDITERKQAEEARLRLAAIVESSEDAIISKSLDGIVTSWNAGAERIFGYRAEEMIGQPILRLLPEDRHGEEAMILERLRRDERVDHFETVRRTKNGRLLDVSLTISPISDAHGTIIGASKIARDITTRKQAEAALRRSEQELADFFENATVGLHWVSPDGTILRVNQAELDLLGYTREEYVGHHIAEFHADQEVIGDMLRRLARQETLCNHEARLRCKDGSLKTVLIDSNVLWENGQFIHTRCFTRDITARKQAEAERERLFTELQRINDELQQFAHIVSHDLNEPLRTVSSYVKLLSRRYLGKLDADADDYITFAVDGAQRMQRMITDLLAYTRAGQTPEFTAVDCENVLTSVLSALQARITECGAVITHDPLPTVRGDATRLSQVLQNLIGNALKFCTAQPCIHISARHEDQHWRFAVRDNGIGIDPKQAGRLFQVFQRLHCRSEYPGTGIGLAICKKIVERHGGRIWVESQPGEGATFYFIISDMRGGGEPRSKPEPDA